MEINEERIKFLTCRDCWLKKIIAARALEIYEARMAFNMPGDETSDWLEAEGEVMLAFLEKTQNEK